MAEQVEVEVTVSRTLTIRQECIVSFPTNADEDWGDIYDEAQEKAMEAGWETVGEGEYFDCHIENEEVLEPKKEKLSEQNILL